MPAEELGDSLTDALANVRQLAGLLDSSAEPADAEPATGSAAEPLEGTMANSSAALRHRDMRLSPASESSGGAPFPASLKDEDAEGALTGQGAALLRFKRLLAPADRAPNDPADDAALADAATALLERQSLLSPADREPYARPLADARPDPFPTGDFAPKGGRGLAPSDSTPNNLVRRDGGRLDVPDVLTESAQPDWEAGSGAGMLSPEGGFKRQGEAEAQRRGTDAAAAGARVSSHDAPSANPNGWTRPAQTGSGPDGAGQASLAAELAQLAQGLQMPRLTVESGVRRVAGIHWLAEALYLPLALLAQLAAASRAWLRATGWLLLDLRQQLAPAVAPLGRHLGAAVKSAVLIPFRAVARLDLAGLLGLLFALTGAVLAIGLAQR